MSDALILGLFTPVMIAISTWVTIVINARVAARVAANLAAQITENNKKLVVVENKLEENHKQQNGNLDKLIKTTSELATAQEKAREKANPTKK